MANKNNQERRWSVPSKRAKGYADDRKAKVHTYGPNEGKELSDYQLGMRSGYLQCQSDHAGMYKYKKALSEGKSVPEARKISRQIGKATAKKKNDKGAYARSYIPCRKVGGRYKRRFAGRTGLA